MLDSLTTVVTTRNRRAILPMTLGTILDQKGVDLRVIVIDEGSSDGSSDYLAALADPRVTVIRHERPVGLPEARNVGFRHADTTFVAVCDDDDLWSPTKARAQLDRLSARPDAGWAVAGTVLVDDDLDVIGCREMDDDGDTLARMLAANQVPCVSGLVVRRDLWEEVGPWDPGMRASEDWELSIRLAAASPVVSLHGPHVAYRVGRSSMSTDLKRMRSSLHTIRDRYADLAARHGVRVDEVGYETYLARQAVSSSQRLDAARGYLHVARRTRRPQHLVRATAALLAPGWMDRVGTRRAISRIPPAFLAEARAWLSEVPRLDPDGLVAA